VFNVLSLAVPQVMMGGLEAGMAQVVRRRLVENVTLPVGNKTPEHNPLAPGVSIRVGYLCGVG